MKPPLRSRVRSRIVSAEAMPGAAAGAMPGTAPGAAPVQAPLGGNRADALRRLQIGASGLVAVLLLVGLASIVRDRATEADNTAVAGAAPTTAPTSPDATGDPLAEAGMVPDIPDTDGVGAAAAGPDRTTPSDAR